MTGIQTLAARGALGLLGALATPLVGRLGLEKERSRGVADKAIVPLFALSRLAAFALIFGVLHIAPRGDVPSYYYPEAVMTLAGRLPYRDFVNSYGPLHSYLDACAVALWRSPLAIILLAIVAEIVMLAVWSSIGKAQPGEARRRAALLMYAVSPLSVMLVTIDGQNNVIIALFLAISVWFALQERRFLSGSFYALTACAVKFLSLIYLPIFVFVLRRWSKWVLGFAATILVVYGGFAALHAPILQPLTAEGNYRGAGCLPYLIEAFAGVEVNGRVWDDLLLAALLAVLGMVFAGSRSDRTELADLTVRDRFQLYTFMYGAVAITMTLLILSKKSWATYLLMVLFPLCVLITESKGWFAWLFGVFQWIAVIEHSFWSSVLLQPTSLQLHALLRSGNPTAAALSVIDVLLIAGYVVFLVLALRHISRRSVSSQVLSASAA